MTSLVAVSGPSAQLLIRGAHALDPRAGLDAPIDVLLRDGLIAELGSPGALSAAEGTEVIDAEGQHLFPGFVDPHVHLRTPGQEHKEDLETGTRAAAAGGFCAVVAMPNTDPVVDSPELIGALREAATREARVAVGFLGAITRDLEGRELTEMAELRRVGALGFTDDGRPVSSAEVLRLAMQYQRLCGGVLALHEEDLDLSRGGSLHDGPVAATLGIRGAPSLAESTMVTRDLALAEYEDARVHLQHLSCQSSVRAVAEARERGVHVSAEASPHHLLLTDEDVRSLDTRLKMNPPLRTETDRQALIDGLRSGVIDCVATDHAPHAREDKEVPFEQAAMGTTGLETAFAALHDGLVVPGVLSLDVLVERMTAGAAAMGIPVPRIAPGEPANLCLADLNASWRAGEAGWESRSQNCCFAGRRLQGRVLLTVAAGQVAYRERSWALAVA
jgi:dihydroorotase